MNHYFNHTSHWYSSVAIFLPNIHNPIIGNIIANNIPLLSHHVLSHYSWFVPIVYQQFVLLTSIPMIYSNLIQFVWTNMNIPLEYPKIPLFIPCHLRQDFFRLMRTASEQQASGERGQRGHGALGRTASWNCGKLDFLKEFLGLNMLKPRVFWCFFAPERQVPLAFGEFLCAWGGRLKTSTKYRRLSENPWDGQHSDEQGDEGYERLAECDQRSSTAIFDHWDDHSLDVGTCSAKSLVPSTANVIFGDLWKRCQDCCHRDIRDQTTGVIQMRWDGRSDR